MSFLQHNEGRVVRLDAFVDVGTFIMLPGASAATLIEMDVFLGDKEPSFTFWGQCKGKLRARPSLDTCLLVTVIFRKNPLAEPNFGTVHAGYFEIKGYYSVEDIFGGQGSLTVLLRPVPAESIPGTEQHAFHS